MDTLLIAKEIKECIFILFKGTLQLWKTLFSIFIELFSVALGSRPKTKRQRPHFLCAFVGVIYLYIKYKYYNQLKIQD